MSVMVLTGRAEMEERVRCLDLEAGDVVLKPISFHELRAQLNALCRRRGRFEETVLRFGDPGDESGGAKCDAAGTRGRTDGNRILCLESLLRRRGERVCSRMELLREVWRTPVVAGTNIVEVCINYLRKKLDRTLGSMRASVIRTVRGEGYVLHAVDCR